MREIRVHGPPLPTGIRIVVGIALLAHLVVVGSILTGRPSVIWPLHNDTVHRLGPGADFYAVYHAGVNMTNGLSPYRNNRDGVTPYFYGFRYLPPVASVARLATVVSPETAYRLWLLVLEGVLFAWLALLSGHVGDKRLWAAVTCILLLGSPYFLELHMGQFTFFATALCMMAVLAGAARGAALFCVSALAKPLTIVAVPALLRHRSSWKIVITALAGLVLLSLPHFSRHPDDWERFYAINFHLEGGLDSGNYGLLQLLHLTASDLGWTGLLGRWGPFTGALRLGALLAVGLIVLLSRNADVRTGVCALLLAHFVTYQHVWEHHMTAVLVCASMLLTAGTCGRRARLVVLAAMVLLALPTPYVFFDAAKDPAVWDAAPIWPRSASYLIVLPKVVPTLALFAVCLYGLLRPGLALPVGLAGSEALEPLEQER